MRQVTIIIGREREKQKNGQMRTKRIWRNEIDLKRQKRNAPNAKKVSTTLRKDVRTAALNKGMFMIL